ncbi:CaiB/BaiF CoA transferase family protein [Bordetella pertussis]|uniref:CaiB/BaiF CoA transferase family protein n=1 Tax=Bordetella pertussis TaxID=520 RepID=UPI0003168C12|nr:CoA transferase [Bordetella pertussis]KCV22345.1 CoA-transferase family III protein [Bordetella pertussis B200]AJB27914.1 putative dehydratase/racemase [Bordetella pertussis 137]ANT90911.1 acetyl-CoA acetyltransferase [Bordetella pertussis]AOY22827.1 acetyl-CoA acetyltransferase [Bordetella pertussis]AUR72706.1 CoA transferase [Bordetella pertussis]
MKGPLDGVRIVDLTTVLMGPFATQMLGDMGADVIKIEAPHGDVSRQIWPYRHPGMGHMFMNVNRNKRSVVLDLKHAEARKALFALLAGADALIYNIRPRAMARIGLSYDEVARHNPRLLYVGAFGYSQRGPYAAKPAYEDLIQGAVGLPHLFQRQGSQWPHYAPINLADRTVGLQIVNAVCAGLFCRERTGQGQRIDVPMFEAMLALVMGEHLGGAGFEPPVDGLGYNRILTADRRPFATRDGHICVLIYNDKQWQGYCRLIGRPELAADPRYATAASRSQQYSEINGLLASEFAQRDTQDWIAAFEAADIPVQKMNDLQDILDDPHLNAIDYFQEHPHPTEGTIRTTAPPVEWSGTPGGYRRHAPRLGEHTLEVLREAGIGQGDIDALLASGAARCAVSG